MTDFKKIFIDTAPIVYFLEENEYLISENKTVTRFFETIDLSTVRLVTSAVTIEEYLVFPYKENRTELILNFEEFLEEMDFEILDINRRTAKKAAQIRGKFTSFKALDCLQLSAAVCSDCGLFVTNDRRLKQFDGIKIAAIAELEQI